MPPYSISTWNREKFEHDKYGRCFLGCPPQGRADYAFIQHILASMDEKTGRCAILLPHGVLNRMTEKAIREKLLEADLVDSVISIGKNLFFNSPMEACILICQRNKPKERRGKILLIRATDLVERKNKDSFLTSNHIEQIRSLYFDFKNQEGRSTVVNVGDIPSNKYSISPKFHVKSLSQRDSEDIDVLVSEWSISANRANTCIVELSKTFSNGVC